MTGRLRSHAVAFFAVVALLATTARASSFDRTVADAARIAAVRTARHGVSALASTCPTTAILPPVTIQGTMTTGACTYIGARDNAYLFIGTAGQTLTFDYYSTAFDVFMVLDGPQTLEFGVRKSYISDNGTSRITLTYTLPLSGEYTIEAMTLYDFDDMTRTTTGPYTMNITLGTLTTTCTADSHKLCLNNNRFAVSATWKTPDGTTGTGTAVPLTPDTGYFWFFGPANIELVIKVLDGRGVNNRFWVFYGALSNVEYTITVVDTEKNITKTFTNPQGRLASVADTSAFDP